jgi:hypothetical protein
MTTIDGQQDGLLAQGGFISGLAGLDHALPGVRLP